MKKSRLLEAQIIGMLREHEAGATVAALARKYGMSTATFNGRKAKFGRTCPEQGGGARASVCPKPANTTSS